MLTSDAPSFPLLPEPAALCASLESAGLGEVTGMRLFPYSSCTPAILITLSHGDRRKVVVRGPQQNDLEWSPPKAISLEKEIRTLQRLRAAGVNVPEVLSGDSALSVKGRDARSGRQRQFRFYVMGFIPGIAVDRKVRNSDSNDRAYYFSRIANIYAGLHRAVGPGFGIMDAAGRPATSSPARSFDRFLPTTFDEKCDLVSRYADPAVGTAVRRWASDRVPRVLDMLAASGYDAKPRLVLYDGSAGNMLVSGRRIGIIDIALTGYFDVTTEFCGFFHAMKDVLLQDHDGRSFWTLFAAEYQDAGGILPPERVLWALIHLGQVLLQLHNLVYNATHNNPARHARVREMHRAVSNLMALKNATPVRLAAALT